MAPLPPNPTDFGLSPEAGVGGKGGWDFSGSSQGKRRQQRCRCCGHKTKDFSQAHHSPPTPKPASETRSAGRKRPEGGRRSNLQDPARAETPTHARHASADAPPFARTRAPVRSTRNATDRSVDVATPQEAAASNPESPPRKPLGKPTLT
jgi:hypothetical protein